MVKENYLAAGVVTLFVFLSGMIVEYQFDQARTGDMVNRINEMQLTTNSLIVEKEILKVFEEDECKIYADRLGDIAGRVSIVGNTLEDYEDNSLFQEEKYAEMKHEYTLLQLFYWAKLVEIKKACDNNDFAEILYFYSEDCKDVCGKQGVVLTDLKRTYSNRTMIFSFDSGFADREPNLRTVMKEFNVTSVPAIVINSKTRLEGFTGKDKLAEIVNGELH